MPLLEIIQTRQISASIRLDEATATQVDQYAAFIHATADDVVDKALNYVFSKDRDFQEFLKTSLAAQVAPSLRIRKAAVADAAESPERKTAGGVESVAPDAWTESVKYLEILWQEPQRCFAPEEI